MQRLCLPLLLLALTVPAQDPGGRDGGAATAVVFVRSRRTAESGEIWHAAWRALEPHEISRERLADFDGSASKAKAFFGKHARAALVVTFDLRARQLVPEGFEVLRVGDVEGDHVFTRTDREQLAEVLRLFKPSAMRIVAFGGTGAGLPGFEVVVFARPWSLWKDCDLAWIPEGAPVDAAELRKELDRRKIPLVSTAAEIEPGLAALTVRPDPRSLGLNLASLVLQKTRRDKKLRQVRVRRMRVTVDLAAARAAGHEVPLALLARADAIRRAP